MERALERGWVDLAYRHFSDQVPTFLTKRSSAHQLDYLFADEETAESCVDVMVDRSRTDLAGDGSSDHAPVIATFRF